MRNTLNKFRIFSSNLLLIIGFSVGMASDDAQNLQNRNDIRKQRTLGMQKFMKGQNIFTLKLASAMDRCKRGIAVDGDRNLLSSQGITPNGIFRSKGDIDEAWSPSNFDMTKTVVRVDLFNDSGNWFGYGTGTLINVDIPKLKRRVVVTCAHCAEIDCNNWLNYSPHTKINSNIQDIIRFHAQQHSSDLPGYFGKKNDGVFVSVTPQFVRPNDGKPLTSFPSYTEALHCSLISPVEEMFILSIDNNHCHDICVMILKNQLLDESDIVKGIKWTDLSTDIGDQIPKPIPGDDFKLYHQHLSEQGNMYAYGIKGSLANTPGYKKFREKVRYSFFGEGTKKVIHFKALDLTVPPSGVARVFGCVCNPHTYSLFNGGDGCSGAFICLQNETDEWIPIGIYSGPFFTKEIKDFIENAVISFMEDETGEILSEDPELVDG